jgi:hypothetical protein
MKRERQDEKFSQDQILEFRKYLKEDMQMLISSIKKLSEKSIL